MFVRLFVCLSVVVVVLVVVVCCLLLFFVVAVCFIDGLWLTNHPIMKNLDVGLLVDTVTNEKLPVDQLISRRTHRSKC